VVGFMDAQDFAAHVQRATAAGAIAAQNPPDR